MDVSSFFFFFCLVTAWQEDPAGAIALCHSVHGTDRAGERYP